MRRRCGRRFNEFPNDVFSLELLGGIPMHMTDWHIMQGGELSIIFVVHIQKRLCCNKLKKSVDTRLPMGYKSFSEGA